MESKAREFAFFYHNKINHVRKYTGEPYTVHLASVVEIVRSVPHTEEMICAAWLHDVVEDTTATHQDVFMNFGIRIASLVEQLTDVSKLSDGNRAIRKEIDRQHLAKASPKAKTVKLADIIDNTVSITQYDPGFAKIFLAEKAKLMEVLTEGDATLYQLALKNL